ncbi:MAG: hypothetical protein NTZ05_19895 [Chloroflexi bacterium]|nr:hypothetical protein [Chloroflexota bacterium]
MMLDSILGWFGKGKAVSKGKKTAKPPAPSRRRRPSLMAEAPMYSQMEAYALDLLSQTGERFPTIAARNEAVKELAEEIDEMVHDLIYNLLAPEDRSTAESMGSDAERHAFLRAHLDDVEAKVTWAMSEFRMHYLSERAVGQSR